MVLYDWLGLWIIRIANRFDRARPVCGWLAEKLPLFLTGKGALRAGEREADYFFDARGQDGKAFLRKAVAADWGPLSCIAVEVLLSSCRTPKEDVAALVNALNVFDQEREALILRGIFNKLYTPHDTEEVIEWLKSPDRDTRVYGAVILSDNRYRAKCSMAALETALHDVDSLVRIAAAFGLGENFEAAAEQIPALLAALGDSNAVVRRYAAKSIGKIRKDAFPAIPVLRDLIRDRSAAVRTEALMTLGIFGRESRTALPLVIAAVDDRAGIVREAAVWALGNIGTGGEEIRVLMPLLRDRDPVIIRKAATALGDIGAPAFEAVPALFEIIEHPVPEIRKEALISIGRIGSVSQAGFVRILTALGDARADIRCAALWTLVHVDAPPEIAVPILVRCLAGVDEKLEGEARYLVEETYRPAPRSCAASLRDFLRSSDPAARKSALLIAGYTGCAAYLLPDIIIQKYDEHEEVSKRADWVFRLWRNQAVFREVLPGLVDQLTDPSRKVQADAARVIAAAGEEAADVVPALLNVLIAGQSRVRAEVGSILASLYDNALNVSVAELLDTFNAASPGEQINLAFNVLAVMKTDIDPVADYMLARLDGDPGDFEVSLASDVLQRIIRNTDVPIGKAARIIRGTGPGYKKTFIQALGRRAGEDYEAELLLWELVRGPDEETSKAAFRALSVTGRSIDVLLERALFREQDPEVQALLKKTAACVRIPDNPETVEELLDLLSAE